jgi:carbamoyl-phosphate synthase small subunit
MADKLYLVLENGRVFEGRAFGASGEVTGEIVFTTGMTGYLETLTDQSYHGQIVVQTFPLIGNYGLIPEDFESDSVGASAYIVRHWCQEPSNFRSEGSLDTFLKARNIVGLCEIDTRALTKIIRESGVMNGRITLNPDSVDPEELKKYAIKEAVESVTASGAELYKSREGRYKVALIDYGLKYNIKRELLKRQCDVWVFPAHSGVGEILSVSPDGIMLSNGPGDPADNPGIIRSLIDLQRTNIPIFGICLGHQLLALSNGFDRFKLKYGHRGANQPVRDCVTGRVYITSQNHGYAITSASIDPDIAKERFINVNDGTCEGIDYLKYPAFSVQFHPEASSGPLDTSFLFDRFTGMMEERSNAAQ